MRLKPLPSPPQPDITPKKRGISRFIYLLLLLALALAAVRWGIQHFSLIQAPGVIEGERVILEAPLAAKIERMNIQIGDRINIGQELIFLDTQGLSDQIKQQESEVRALKAAYQTEQKRLPLLLTEQNNELLLKQNAVQHDRQRLIGEMEQLQLKLSQLNKQAAQQERLLAEGRRLLQLNAITQSQFRDIKLKLQEMEDETSRTALKLQTCQQELAHIQHILNIIKENRGLLPQHIKGKSTLPVLKAKLAAAAQKLTLLQASLKERVISSPLSGVVTQILKRTGEVVTTGEAIAEIVDPASIHVQAFFDPKHQQQLAEGNRVQLLFDDQRMSQGIIRKFYPATNPLPPQFQQAYKPHKRALIAEIQPIDRKEWPLTIGLGVKVRKKRW